MARQPNPAVAQRWTQLIQDQQTSSLTVAAFCRQHNVSVPSFYNWRRKLREHSTQQPNVGEFLPLKIKSHQEPNATIEFPGGARMEIPANDVQILMRIIDHLSGNKENLT